MAYEFLNQDITEARYLRKPSDATGYSEYDIADTFFEHLLALQQMRFENPKAAQKYAQDTLRHMNFTQVRTGGTDLHNLASILNNPSKYKDKLADAGSVRFDELKFKRYLRDVAAGKLNQNVDRQFFMQMQRNLNNRNSLLKNARRITQDYGSSTSSERRAVGQRLTNTFRQDGKFRSDIFKPYATGLAAKGIVDTDSKKSTSISKGVAKTLGKAALAGAAGYAIGRKFF